MKKIAIVNGVNLGELGTREVNIYGTLNFETYFEMLRQRFPQFELHYFQSNSLTEMVDYLLTNKTMDGFILNPGAYTHQSIVLADTLKTISQKVVEVHISNLFNRETYRRKSFIASACSGTITGFGLKSYDLALFSFID